MRWPPVILTIGTSYFSATSAIRRSCAGGGDAALHLRDDRERAVVLDVGVHAVVDEPGVASRRRTRRPRSSSAARPAPIFDFASSAPSGASAAKHRRHRLAGPARGSPPSAPACPSGCRARTSSPTGPPSTAPPAAHSTICADQGLARAAALAGPGRVHHPADAVHAAVARTRTSVALGDAVAVADLRRRRPARPTPCSSASARRGRTAARRAPRAAAARGRRPGSGTRPCVVSPSRVAPISLSSRMTTRLVDAALAARRSTTNSSVVPLRALDPHRRRRRRRPP